MTGISLFTSGLCAARCGLALGALATSEWFCEYWRFPIIATTLPLLALVDCRRVGVALGGVVGTLLWLRRRGWSFHWRHLDLSPLKAISSILGLIWLG